VVGKKVNDGSGKKWLQKKEPFAKRKEKNRTWSIFRALLGLVLHLLRKRFARRGLLRLLLLRGWLLWSFGWGSTPLQDKKKVQAENQKQSQPNSQYQEEGYTFFFTGVFFGVGTSSELEELELESDTSSNTRPLMSMGRCFIVYKNHKKII
jgi:hypothetical protein